MLEAEIIARQFNWDIPKIATKIYFDVHHSLAFPSNWWPHIAQVAPVYPDSKTDVTLSIIFDAAEHIVKLHKTV